VQHGQRFGARRGGAAERREGAREDVSGNRAEVGGSGAACGQCAHAGGQDRLSGEAQGHDCGYPIDVQVVLVET